MGVEVGLFGEKLVNEFSFLFFVFGRSGGLGVGEGAGSGQSNQQDIFAHGSESMVVKIFAKGISIFFKKSYLIFGISFPVISSGATITRLWGSAFSRFSTPRGQTAEQMPQPTQEARTMSCPF